MSKSYQQVEMPSLLDREIQNEAQDAFGHRHFALGLKSLIESHDPPYSIGLLGKWGVGKSSVKEIYLADLKNDTTKKPSKSLRKNMILPITFNAWRYGGTDIKRDLPPEIQANSN